MVCNYRRRHVFFLLTVLFLALVGVKTNAQLLDTKISMHLESGKLDRCLLQLQKASGMSFAYEAGHLPLVQVSSRFFRKKRMADILDYTLAGTGYQFEERHSVIMIYATQKKEEISSFRSICGIVTDRETGEHLYGAAVHIAQSHNLGAISDSNGYFRLNTVTDSIKVRISYLGYDDEEVFIAAGKNSCRPVSLVRARHSLNSVLVNNPVAATAPPDKVSLSEKNFSFLPKFGGEIDLVSVLKTTPGVQETFDGSGNLVIRGGAPDQNLILMDGATMYNSTHLLGLLSSVNAGAVDRLDVYKGAFPARYGGRISSIWDITMKKGNDEATHGDISLSSVSTDIMVEGPLFKNKTTFMLAFRRSYHDLYKRIFRPGLTFYFQDANFKLRHKFSEKDELSFTTYYSQDRFATRNNNYIHDDIQVISDIKQFINNHVSVLKWRHCFSDNFVGHASVALSGYDFYTGDKFVISDPSQRYESATDFNTGLKDITVKAGVKYSPRRSHSIEGGLYYTNYNFKPSTFTITDKMDSITNVYIASVNRITAREIGLYVEDHVSITQKLRADIGIHATSFTTTGGTAGVGKTYYGVQPRLNAHYSFGNLWSLNASYVRMQQNIHRLTGSYTSLSSDFWIPATDIVRPQYADQVSLGLSGKLFREKVTVSVEPYYKRMHNVAELLLTSSLPVYGPISWDQSIVTGKGDAYGIEFLAQKNVGDFNGRISYTLASSTRTLPEVNNGKTFAYKYDRRHNLNLMAFYKWGESIELSAVFNFQSTPPNPVLMIKTVDVPQFQQVLAELNNNTGNFLKAYHRLDVGVNFIKKRKNTVRSWSVSIFNVYNRENAFFYLGSAEGSASMSVNNDSLLPLSIVVGYRLSF